MTATDWARTASGIGEEVAAERARAAAKHGDTSMEAQPWDAPIRLAVLAEEVGEAADEITTHGPAAKGRRADQARSALLTAAQGRVAKALNDARHEQRPVDPEALRRALREVASVALTWAALAPRGSAVRHELVQVVAMATSWLDACPVTP